MSRMSQIQAQTNPILTTFAQGWTPAANFISRKVAPVVPVIKESGTVYTFGKEGFQVYNTERALRANAKQVDFALGSSNYLCVEHALESQLDHEEIKEAARYGAAEVLQLKKRAAMLTQTPLDIALEKAVADRVMGATYYATGNKVTLSGTSQWRVSGGGEGSASNPINDINAGLDAARADMGVRPNTIVFGYAAWSAFSQHPLVLDRIKYAKSAVITPADAAALLGIQNVVIGEAVYDNAGTWTDMWGDSVALIYVPSKGQLAEGTTPHTVIFEQRGYPLVQQYADAYRLNFVTKRKYEVKNISTSYGYLISDTNA